MRKFGLGLMLVAMLAVPVLACGFPLPAGTEMMQVSKTVCADGEAVESCQMRQDAYQQMGKLQSAVVRDLNMALTIDSADEQMEVFLTGWYEYVVNESGEGIGADLHVVLDAGEMMSADGTESLDAVEAYVIGNTVYSTEDGGETWTYEELNEDSLLGLSMLLGVGGEAGAGLDLFSDSGIFSVTTGEDEYEGQQMHVQTLEVDLGAMLASPDALGGLMDEGFQAGGDSLGMSEEDLGMAPEDLAMAAAFMLPMLAGTEFSTTIYIGADDGYIYYVENSYNFQMDMSSFDPETGAMAMVYQLSGYITEHNVPITLSPPEGAIEGEGFFGGDVFGGGGLGDSLFGG